MARHDWVLSRAKAALVVVDVQERLLAEVVDRERVQANVRKLLETARVLRVPVLVTEHHAKVFGSTAVSLPVVPIQKIVFSCFGLDEFRGKVFESGRSQLILCGLETHICVCQTALDALVAGYQIHVVRDACSARASENHAIGLAKMERAGAIPASTETVMFELLERGGTEEFRALLPVIKGRP
ncbi:MAG: isochorismatase family protein [Planctomycetes bacterium]|nr:isochorismatase family protein [Planctomycetota bacterium]